MATQESTMSTRDNKVLPTAESIQSIGGLVAVVTGVLAITGLAIATMAFIDSGKDANTMIPLTTAAFGVISAVVGAYLGIKLGTDQSKGLAQDVSEAHVKLAAMQSLVPEEKQEEALAVTQGTNVTDDAPRHGGTG
jgi:hypothetical protein